MYLAISQQQGYQCFFECDVYFIETLVYGYWRASEASETLLVVVQWKTRYVYTYIYVYVIARVGVKFGINFKSVRLSGNKIARGEAECYLTLNLTRVKFVPEISRLTVLLKINTIASLLFI